MAAQAHLEAGGSAEDAAIRESIAGNLCRCTGHLDRVGDRGRRGRALRDPARGWAVGAPVASPRSLPMRTTCWRRAAGPHRRWHRPDGITGETASHPGGSSTSGVWTSCVASSCAMARWSSAR
ncbi:MAG: hypothetical protein U0667_15515 [Chloroflexota bacterium]